MIQPSKTKLGETKRKMLSMAPIMDSTTISRSPVSVNRTPWYCAQILAVTGMTKYAQILCVKAGWHTRLCTMLSAQIPRRTRLVEARKKFSIGLRMAESCVVPSSVYSSQSSRSKRCLCVRFRKASQLAQRSKHATATLRDKKMGVC